MEATDYKEIAALEKYVREYKFPETTTSELKEAMYKKVRKA